MPRRVLLPTLPKEVIQFSNSTSPSRLREGRTHEAAGEGRNVGQVCNLPICNVVAHFCPLSARIHACDSPPQTVESEESWEIPTPKNRTTSTVESEV